jgi:hypothetical protein
VLDDRGEDGVPVLSDESVPGSFEEHEAGSGDLGRERLPVR